MEVHVILLDGREGLSNKRSQGEELKVELCTSIFKGKLPDVLSLPKLRARVQAHPVVTSWLLGNLAGIG
jgi:hypothetical protein